jgi:Chemoreceptor zinc-binding domain
MGIRGWLVGLLGGDTPQETPKAMVEVARDPMEEEADGLNFRSAIEAHQKWKVRLRAVIENNSSENLVPEVVSRDDQCVLGKWIHGAGGAKFAKEPQFIDLKKKHAYFHVCAGNVLQLAQSGDKVNATAEITSGNFARTSQEVVLDLAQMFTRLKK